MRALLILLSVLLAACHGRNPYQAESLPLPPAPAEAARTFDQSAYPPPVQDFSHYRSWAWYTPPLGISQIGSDQLQLALSSALDQRSLRPAHGDQSPDLLIGASLRSERRIRQYYDHSGLYYGHGHHDHYGAWSSIPIVRTYEERILVTRIDFFDAASRQLLWSTQGEALLGNDPNKALYAALKAALDHYPFNR